MTEVNVDNILELQNEKSVNQLIKNNQLDTNKISDGYHTFGELYDHRIALFITLCNMIYRQWEEAGRNEDPFYCVPWKSKVHSDGSEWKGWFIAGINQEKDQQLSYHLPISKWDELEADELDMAPEWDGHTPADVIERLKKL